MFDDRLKKLRLARGLSQAELAAELGLPQKTYCNYERNEREPSAVTLIRIAAYFGVTLDYLLDFKIPDDKKSLPPETDDEREAYREALSQLSDEELTELKQFTSYLLWKRTQRASGKADHQ